MSLSDYTMPIGDVARALNVTTERVRQLDDELQPVRVGRFRRYRPAIVERVLEQRAAPLKRGRQPTVATDDEADELTPEVRAEIDAAIASFLEAQRREREAIEHSAHAFRKFIDVASASIKIDSGTRTLVEDYARACARLGEIDRQRKRERVILLSDVERDEAHMRIVRLEQRVNGRVTTLLAKARAAAHSRAARPRSPNGRAPHHQRTRRAARRSVRSARSTADPDPEPEPPHAPRLAHEVCA